MSHSSAAFLAELSMYVCAGAFSLASVSELASFGLPLFPSAALLVCFGAAAHSIYRMLLKGA